jgi:hypothetical protein
MSTPLNTISDLVKEQILLESNDPKCVGSLIVCAVFIFLLHSYRSKNCSQRSPKIFSGRDVLN